MKKKIFGSSDTFGRRIVQISMDVEIPENDDNYLENIENILDNSPKFQNSGYYLAGIEFSDDLTDEYADSGWWDDFR